MGSPRSAPKRKTVKTGSNNRLPLNRRLAAILLVALLLRVAAAIAIGDEIKGLSGAFDEVTYSELGHRLATGHGLTFPTDWYPWIKADAPQSYFSFAMSACLAVVYWLFGYHPLIARLIMALVSTGVVAMIYVVGRRYFSETIGMIAAGIAAVHAYLIFYGASLVTETPFTLALLISLFLADRLRETPSPRLWAGLGVALAAAVQFRMAVVFFVPVLLIWIAAAHAGRQRLWAVTPLAAIAITVLPFTIWNYQTWGQPMALQSQFGHVFWNGNHPEHHGDFHPYRVFEIPADVLALDNDALITNRLLELGIENVKADPMHFAQLTVTRLREMFVFWPRESSSASANALRVLSFGLLAPFCAAGFFLCLAQWRRLIVIYLFIASHVGIHAVTWAMVRYRVPIDPFLILFASYALVRLLALRRGAAMQPAY